MPKRTPPKIRWPTFVPTAGEDAAARMAKAIIEQARQEKTETLYLSQLGLATLPDSIEFLEWLVQIDVSENELQSVPDFIRYLPRLQNLNFDGNLLTKLPEWLHELCELRCLSLSRNRLSSLPGSLGACTNLEELYLHGNSLTILPESLSRLSRLRVLQISENTLEQLPKSLWSPRLQLRELYLQDNPRLQIPPEVLGPLHIDVVSRGQQTPAKAADVLNYYFRIQGAQRPLNEAKVILVGHGFVGKTSIVERLLHNRFSPNQQKTEGIQISDWWFRLADQDDIRLHIWDFGGQEIMHATHQFFLTQRSIYLLVLSGREGGVDADAEYWLKLIESFGAESPVIIVLNKIKETPFDLNRRGLQQKYPAIRKFIRTDCADGTGIDELRTLIQKETDQLEHLRDAFPAAWISIKDRLAGMQENYVTFEHYRAICSQHGEVDPSAQDSLAFYLHSLGVALNYKDDPRLREKHVLNPHWVTRGIYQILNAERLARQKGELRLDEVGAILPQCDYPQEMHGFLFDLMKKFELCFSFPDDERHYLIPELLDKEEPDTAREFPPTECLNFQYHYPILPEGLLPRFIVRTHVLSEGQARWRTGAVLQFEGNRALVKADVQDRRVFIAVTGPTAGRRRLLAVIRSDLEHIHRGFFQKLEPIEMVPVPSHPTTVIPYRELLGFEDNGLANYPKMLDGRVEQLNVRELLDGVDLEGIRRKENVRELIAARVFISYSHKDELLRNELETHLKLLQRSGLISSWHDRKIEAGEDWQRKIDENLESADIIILLISPDFLASDYCYDKEMKRALERHKAGEARAIPVVVRDVNWHASMLGDLLALPRDGLAISNPKWRSKDLAWKNVSEGVERLVREFRERKSRA